MQYLFVSTRSRWQQILASLLSGNLLPPGLRRLNPENPERDKKIQGPDPLEIELAFMAPP